MQFTSKFSGIYPYDVRYTVMREYMPRPGREQAKAVARPVMDLQAGRGICPVRNISNSNG